jgi:protein-tyrosine phosphatase
MRFPDAGVSPSNIKKGVDFALEQRRLGRAVLVHCAHGHGRSAGVILACMIVAGEVETIEEGALLVPAHEFTTFLIEC